MATTRDEMADAPKDGTTIEVWTAEGYHFEAYWIWNSDDPEDEGYWFTHDGGGQEVLPVSWKAR